MHIQLLEFFVVPEIVVDGGLVDLAVLGYLKGRASSTRYGTCAVSGSREAIFLTLKNDLPHLLVYAEQLSHTFPSLIAARYSLGFLTTST